MPSRKNGHNAHLHYRPDIDGLRGIAILAVVLFHYFPGILPGGFVGVDVFFVISGFLISGILFRSFAADGFYFAEFYAHRIKRIFPALITVLLACLMFGWFALTSDELRQLGKHMAASAGFVQNFILRNEVGYFNTDTELKPLMHLWSLSIEEQFYLLYPLLIWGAWRIGRGSGRYVPILLLFLAVLSFGFNVHGVGVNPNQAFFEPHTRFWELLSGGALAWMETGMKAPLSMRVRDGLSLAGILLIAAAVTLIRQDMPFPGWLALPPVAGAVLMIAAGSSAWLNRRILSHRILVAIGLISYPLYLWHWPLISFARIIGLDAASSLLRPALLAASVLLAWVTWKWIEKPIRFGKLSRRKTAALLGALMVMGGLGWYVKSQDGLSPHVEDRRQGILWLTAYHSTAACWQKTGLQREDSEEYCAFSKEEDLTVALIGDSHSNHLFPGLAVFSAESKDSIASLGAGGCLPFFDTQMGAIVKNGRIEQIDRPCAKLMNQALQVVGASRSMHTVVLSFAGTFYLSEGTRLVKLDRPDIRNPEQVFEMGMRQTLAWLLEQKKSVVLVLDVPVLNFNPRLCLERPPLRWNLNQSASHCGVSRQDFDAGARRYREIVSSVLKDFPAVILFDAGQSFCDAQWCSAMQDGAMMYRDRDHLSVAGSRLVAERLWPVLMNAEPHSR